MMAEGSANPRAILPKNTRFVAAFERALPNVPHATVRLIHEFAIASMVHVLAGQLDPDAAAELAETAKDGEAAHEPLLRALVAHNAAGARALAADAAEVEQG